MDVADVAVEVQKHLDRWNPPADDSGVSILIGEHGSNTGHGPSNSSVDAGRPDLFPSNGAEADSGLPEVPTDEDGFPVYDDMSKKDLQALLEARGLSQSGNKGELVERLEEDDSSD
jgi:hypothetical protein